MNRHKAYWSAMGIEPNQEKSTEQIDFEKFNKQIKIMVGKYGATKTFVSYRNTLKQIQEEDK